MLKFYVVTLVRLSLVDTFKKITEVVYSFSFKNNSLFCAASLNSSYSFMATYFLSRCFFFVYRIASKFYLTVRTPVYSEHNFVEGKVCKQKF